MALKDLITPVVSLFHCGKSLFIYICCVHVYWVYIYIFQEYRLPVG